MICHVFKKKRRNANGKMIADRHYRGRYRLEGDYRIHEVPLDTSDKQVAEQKLKAIIKESEMEKAGIIAPRLERKSASKMLTDHLADFIADLRAKGRAERYVKGVNSSVTTIIEDCSWSIIADIRSDDFIMWRSRQKKAPKTLNEYLNAVNTFLNWMQKIGRISHQPLAKIEKVDIRGKQQKRRAITDEEFLRLLAVSQDYRLLYLSAVYTGLRLGELSGLVWDNVKLDHEQPHIHIPAHLTKNRMQAIIPLHPQLVKEFTNEREGKERTEHLFPYYKNPDRRFQRHRREAGIETIDETGRKLDFHSFRYTFATKLARKGVSQRLTQELMRHSDPKLTANLYTDVSHLPTFEAVQDLDWIAPISEKKDLPATDEDSQICPHIRPQDVVAGCHFLAQTDIAENEGESRETPSHIKKKTAISLESGGRGMVGETGFEPATSGSQSRRSTKLSYSP